MVKKCICEPHCERWHGHVLNCKLKAVHVAGAINILPDTISRLHEIRNQFTNIKHQTQIFEVSPFNITPVKRARKARTCWYRRPFRLIYRYQVKEKYKKGMDRHNIK